MRKCFVCMPLIDETKDIFAAIKATILDSLEGHWECVKANDASSPGVVDEKIVHEMLNADLVIAVIADPRHANPINPNVMYELGVAHSFRKSTIVIADSRIKLPFDIQSVESVQVDFSKPDVIAKVQAALQSSLKGSKFIDEIENRRTALNPITTQLSGTRIFIEDLPWIWGYCDVLKRERSAKTVWEITSDLYWAGEALFFASLTEAIRLRRKRYYMVENDPSVLKKVEDIKSELKDYGIPKNTVNEFVHFVAIDHNYFVLWPIAIVLYDANAPTRKGGIICEPMQSQVGDDFYDKEVRASFKQTAKPDDLGAFEQSLFDLDWTIRRKEATFDIALDGRVVEKLASSFTDIWNKKIVEEANEKTGDERSTLLNNWLIGGRSE